MRRLCSTVVPIKMVPCISLWSGCTKCSLWLSWGKVSKLNNPLGRYPISGTRLLKWHICYHTSWEVGWQSIMDDDEECIQAEFREMSACKEEDKTTSCNRLCSIIRMWVTEGVKWTNKMAEYGTVNHSRSTNITVQRLPHFVMFVLNSAWSSISECGGELPGVQATVQ